MYTTGYVDLPNEGSKILALIRHPEFYMDSVNFVDNALVVTGRWVGMFNYDGELRGCFWQTSFKFGTPLRLPPGEEIWGLHEKTR